MKGRDRMLSDREVAMILRRATALQEETGGSQTIDGLSLETVREIAAEIGVDRQFVDEAAASVLNVRDSRAASLMGGVLREYFTTSYDGVLSAQETKELVDRLRRTIQDQGDLATTLGSTEWTSDGMSRMAVTITPRDQTTDVQIITNRSGVAAPVFTIPAFAGLVLAGIVVDSVQPGNLEALGILVAGLSAGLGLGRAIWSNTTRAFRRRLQKVQTEIRQYMEQKNDPNPVLGVREPTS